MTLEEISDKYTEVVNVNGRWRCILKIGNQAFYVARPTNKIPAQWYQDQLARALKTLIEEQVE